MASFGQSQANNELLATAIDSGIKDVAAMDPVPRKEQLEKLVLASASRGQVVLAIEAFLLFNDQADSTESEKIVVEATDRFAKSCSPEMIIRFIKEARISSPAKDSALVRAATVYCHQKQFQLAAEVTDEISDKQLSRMAKIVTAFFSDDRENLRGVLLSQVDLSLIHI